MKKHISIFIVIVFMLGFYYRVSWAQDTFSICAVDTSNNYVGCSGASCVPPGVPCIRVISDMHPGIGVILSQARYLPQNQNYARTLMNMGLSPQQIIDSLVAHDYENNPTNKQYGIVDLIGGGRRAAYTGVNCPVYRNHILGPTYTIQGNTLLGPQILDSMRSRFLNTSGMQPFLLALKLMAALQGAKVIGADRRCSDSGMSSTTAFIRVATPTDSLWLDICVGNATYGRDPIDSLQTLFNIWISTIGLEGFSNTVPDDYRLYQNYPNPFNPTTKIKFALPKSSFATLVVYDLLGREIEIMVNQRLNAGTYEADWDAANYPTGVYMYQLIAGDPSAQLRMTKKMILIK